jgi:hypothetical protein
LKKSHHKKRAGRVAPVVEHLPSKCEAINSNSSLKRKKEIPRNRGSAAGRPRWSAEVKAKLAEKMFPRW